MPDPQSPRPGSKLTSAGRIRTSGGRHARNAGRVPGSAEDSQKQFRSCSTKRRKRTGNLHRTYFGTMRIKNCTGSFYLTSHFRPTVKTSPQTPHRRQNLGPTTVNRTTPKSKQSHDDLPVLCLWQEKVCEPTDGSDAQPSRDAWTKANKNSPHRGL